MICSGSHTPSVKSDLALISFKQVQTPVYPGSGLSPLYAVVAE